MSTEAGWSDGQLSAQVAAELWGAPPAEELEDAKGQKAWGWRERPGDQASEVAGCFMVDSGGVYYYCRRFAEDIAQAYRVVEKLRQHRWLIRVQSMPDGFPYYGPDDMDPQPKIYRRAYALGTYMPDRTSEEVFLRIHGHPDAIADTEPRAICLMALEAVRAMRAAGVEL